MPMRVISGSAKGRRLKMVPGDSTRPVMDKVKEALFNILGRDVYHAVFLDLFAGTGSIGIEALSRGADQAYFIELDRKAIKVIQENLALTRLADQAIVKQMDAFNFLRQHPPAKFTHIYIAPPQYKKMWITALQELDKNADWLQEDTSIIVQIDPGEQEDIVLKYLEATDMRRYGKTLLWFFRVRKPGAPVSEE